MCSLFVFSYDFTLILKFHEVCNSFRTVQTQTNICVKFLTRKTMYTNIAVTLDIFCIRPFALHCPQPEKDKQNVDFAPLWKNLCGRPCLRHISSADDSLDQQSLIDWFLYRSQWIASIGVRRRVKSRTFSRKWWIRGLYVFAWGGDLRLCRGGLTFKFDKNSTNL